MFVVEMLIHIAQDLNVTYELTPKTKNYHDAQALANNYLHFEIVGRIQVRSLNGSTAGHIK